MGLRVHKLGRYTILDQCRWQLLHAGRFTLFFENSTRVALTLSDSLTYRIFERIEGFTSHWQSVSVHNFAAFPFNSAGERPRGAGSFIVWKKNKQKGKKEKNIKRRRKKEKEIFFLISCSLWWYDLAGFFVVRLVSSFFRILSYCSRVLDGRCVHRFVSTSSFLGHVILVLIVFEKIFFCPGIGSAENLVHVFDLGVVLTVFEGIRFWSRIHFGTVKK